MSLYPKVYTPVATYIDITIHGEGTYSGFMNVDIHMSPKDLEQVEGLCGYMDGNQTNDLRKRNNDFINILGNDASSYIRHHLGFIRSWRYSLWPIP